MDRLLRSLAISIVLFAVVFAFVVGSRIDQNTISLLSGTIVGVMVSAPCVMAITWLVVKRRDEWSIRDNRPRSSLQMPSEPPQYWVVPPDQALSAMQSRPRLAQSNVWAGMQPNELMNRPKRRFFLIGESGDSQEIVDTQAPYRDVGATNTEELTQVF